MNILEWIFGKQNNLDDSKYMFGVDLDEWWYLGRTDLKIGSIEGNVHFFCSRQNSDYRKFVITTISGYRKDFDLHPWVSKFAEPWRHCQFPLYAIINDFPSPYLCDHMLQEFGASWTKTGKRYWWVQTEDSLYKRATMTVPKKETSNGVTEIVDNVVKVDFGSKE